MMRRQQPLPLNLDERNGSNKLTRLYRVGTPPRSAAERVSFKEVYPTPRCVTVHAPTTLTRVADELAGMHRVLGT